LGTLRSLKSYTPMDLDKACLWMATSAWNVVWLSYACETTPNLRTVQAQCESEPDMCIFPVRSYELSWTVSHCRRANRMVDPVLNEWKGGEFHDCTVDFVTLKNASGDWSRKRAISEVIRKAGIPHSLWQWLLKFDVVTMPDSDWTVLTSLFQEFTFTNLLVYGLALMLDDHKLGSRDASKWLFCHQFWPRPDETYSPRATSVVSTKGGKGSTHGTVVPVRSQPVAYPAESSSSSNVHAGPVVTATSLQRPTDTTVPQYRDASDANPNPVPQVANYYFYGSGGKGRKGKGNRRSYGEDVSPDWWTDVWGGYWTEDWTDDYDWYGC
jgi:hypothetical protein